MRCSTRKEGKDFPVLWWPDFTKEQIHNTEKPLSFLPAEHIVLSHLIFMSILHGWWKSCHRTHDTMKRGTLFHYQHLPQPIQSAFCFMLNPWVLGLHHLRYWGPQLVTTSALHSKTLSTTLQKFAHCLYLIWDSHFKQSVTNHLDEPDSYQPY